MHARRSYLWHRMVHLARAQIFVQFRNIARVPHPKTVELECPKGGVRRTEALIWDGLGTPPFFLFKLFLLPSSLLSCLQ